MHLFPTEYLPSDDSYVNYGLASFGKLAKDGEMDPHKTGFGFILATGDSFAVTQLRKRSGQPDPFVFLDCPADVMAQPDDKPQTARVVCVSEDIDGCFRVAE